MLGAGAALHSKSATTRGLPYRASLCGHCAGRVTSVLVRPAPAVLGAVSLSRCPPFCLGNSGSGAPQNHEYVRLSGRRRPALI